MQPKTRTRRPIRTVLFRRHLRVETLEERLAPIVGAFDIPPLVERGVGLDGVVDTPTCTGSLLFTGRHVLTAAHCLDNDANGIADIPDEARFDLPNADIDIPVPISAIDIHPGWTDPVGLSANDIAILTLVDPNSSGSNRHLVAPIGAERYGVYRASDEVGKTIQLVGYGATGHGTQFPINVPGGKRSALNRVDMVPTGGRFGVLDNITIAADFDNGTEELDAFGQLFNIDDLGFGADEGVFAGGDSGGPVFIGNLIAGITSFSTSSGLNPPPPAGTFFGGSAYVWTRVSRFASSYIDPVVSGDYHLVMDMEYQPGGDDDIADSITLRRSGNNLQFVLNGVIDPAAYSLNDILSLEIRGSDDADTFILDLGGGNPIPSGGFAFFGNDGADEIVVTKDTSFSLSNSQLNISGMGTIDLSNVDAATLTGGGSANSFTIESDWSGTATVAGAGGDDTLVLDFSGGIPLSGRDTNFDGGSQSGPTGDTVQLIGYQDRDVVTIQSDRVHNAHVTTTFTGVERLAVDTRSGEDEINVDQSANGVSTTIHGGDDDDTIDLVEVNHNLSVLQGRVTVFGDAGEDTLTLDDQARGGLLPYTISEGGITVSGIPAVITYVSVEDIELNTGGGTNTVTVNDASADLTINTGGGDDTVSVTLTTFEREVTANGGGGANDRLVLFDNTLAGETPEYWVFDDFVSPPSGIGITYHDFDTLAITDGAGNARFDVFGTPAGMDLEITGGAGDDQIDLGEGFSLFAPDTLEHLQGNFVDVHGGNGVDTLRLYDNDHVDLTAYSITEQFVAKFLSFQADYDSIEAIELNGGSNNNPYIVRGTTPAVNLTAPLTMITLNAGSGNDRFEIGRDDDTRSNLAGIQVMIDIHEGLGFDTLILHNEVATACDFTVLENGVLRPGFPALPFVLYDTMEVLNITTGAMVDTVRVIRTPPEMLLVGIDSGAGDDVIELGSNVFVPRALSAIGARVVLDAGAGGGVDRVTLIDVGNTTGASYTITHEDVLRADGTELLSYEGVGLMTFNGGSGPDTFTVESTPANMPVFLNGGAGDDTFNIGSPLPDGGRLSEVRSRVVVDGQADGGRALLFDTANTLPAQYAITSEAVVRQDGTPLTEYENVSSVVYSGGGGRDTITVTDTSTARVSLHGGGGDDRFGVGSSLPGPARLNRMAQPVSLDGGVGVDVALLNDTDNSAPAQYTITNEEVLNASGSRIVDYEDLAFLFLFGGNAGNTFTVESTLGSSIQLDMGSGNDTLHVGSSAPGQGLLNQMAATVSVINSQGIDFAALHDEGNMSGAQYSFVDGTVRRADGTTLFSHDGIRGLYFNAGSGSDTISVESTTTVTPVVINAGSGNDQLHVAAGNLNAIQTAVRIEGDGNSDTLNIHDEAFETHGTYTISSAAVTRLLTAGSVLYGTIETLVLNAGPFDDLISVPNLPQDTNTFIHAGPGNDSVDASPLNRGIQLFGGDGNDVLTSGAGNDELHGGPGNDQLNAGDGEENELSDGPGSDQLTGGSGSDSYFLSLGGADVISDAGGTIHTLSFAPGLGGITIDVDSLNVTQPVRGTETLRLNQPVENVFGTDAGDVFVVRPLNFPRTIDGGEPTAAPGDTLHFHSLGQPATVTATKISVSGFAPLRYLGIETLTGVSRPGDTNDDGLIDCVDLARLAQNFGRISGATRAQGDTDGDGDVDLRDLAILQQGIICSRSVTPAPSAPVAEVVVAPARLAGIRRVARGEIIDGAAKFRGNAIVAVDHVLTTQTTALSTALRARRRWWRVG